MVLADQDPARTAPPARLDWVDALRGFAILLVVIGHSWRGLFAAGLIAPDTYVWLDQAIYSFHIPLFFMLAGFFYIPGLRAADGWRFARSRLMRLLYPLLLWTYIFIAAKLLAGPLANTPLNLQDLWVAPVPGRWHFWFLWALLLMSLALLPLRAVLTDPAWQPWAGPGLLGLAVGLQFIPLTPGLVHWFGPTIRMLPYFIIGVFAGPWLGRLPVSHSSTILAVLLFAGLLAGFAGTTGPGLTGLVLAVTLSGLVILAFAGAGPIPGAPGRGLRWMGTGTMAIFLTHTFFSAALRETLLGLGWRDLPSHMLLSVFVGILGPLWLLSMARRAGMVRTLGF